MGIYRMLAEPREISCDQTATNRPVPRTAYRKSGRLFILRDMPIDRQLSFEYHCPAMWNRWLVIGV